MIPAEAFDPGIVHQNIHRTILRLNGSHARLY
jgi:hypothetical protein